MKRKILLSVSIVMLVFAAGFVIYALNNPQSGFPWSNGITYTIYLVYINPPTKSCVLNQKML